eukprot:369869-Hanusia_phi.AAC.1
MLLCRLPLSPPGGATLSLPTRGYWGKGVLGRGCHGALGRSYGSCWACVMRRGVRAAGAQRQEPLSRSLAAEQDSTVALDAFCFHCHGLTGPGRSSRRRKPDL